MNEGFIYATVAVVLFCVAGVLYERYRDPALYKSLIVLLIAIFAFIGAIGCAAYGVKKIIDGDPNRFEIDVQTIKEKITK